MRRHGGRGDGNSLMQVAAAVVGSASAAQVIRTQAERIELAKAERIEGRKQDALRAEVAALAGIPASAEAAGLDVHAALNTYETGDQPGVRRPSPYQIEVTGDNGRRLILRRTPEGVWVGGCLVSDPDGLDRVLGWLAVWSANMRGVDE